MRDTNIIMQKLKKIPRTNTEKREKLTKKDIYTF